MAKQPNRTDPVTTQDALKSWSIDAFQNATTTCLSAIEHSREMQIEWQHFIRHRLERDANHPENLMNCATPADVFQVQFDFVSDFIRDYTQEIQRMGQMMRDATNQSFSATNKNANAGIRPFGGPKASAAPSEH